MIEIKAGMTIDTRGLICPMPVLKTKKAIDLLGPAQTLLLIASDPASKADILAPLERLGHELISVQEDEGNIYFFIRKMSISVDGTFFQILLYKSFERNNTIDYQLKTFQSYEV